MGRLCCPIKPTAINREPPMKPLNTVIQLAATSSLVLATSAIGAPQDPVGQITRIDGSAMISQGTRYVDAREGMPLRVQDRILVLDGGSALLQFNDGCQYSLEDSEMLTIGTESACAEQAAKTAAATQNGVSVETAAAGNQGSFTNLEQAGTSQLGGSGRGGVDNRGLWILGGLAAVGIVAAVADTGSDNRDDNPPISQ